MHYIKLEGQEAQRVSRRQWMALSAIGSVKLMVKVADSMVDGG